MKMPVKLFAMLISSAAVLMPSVATAQAGPPRALVSIYHAATGHQEALMRWIADQDRVAVAAGVAPAQVYAHTDGDLWDYVVIFPVTTAAQDDALDAAAKSSACPTVRARGSSSASISRPTPTPSPSAR